MAQVGRAAAISLLCLCACLCAWPSGDGRLTIGNDAVEIRYWPGQQDKALEVLRDSRYALETLSRYLDLKMRRRVLIEIVRSEKEFQERVGSKVPTWTLGVSKHHANHVILKPISGDDLRRLVVHELTHVALDAKLRASGSEAPRWVHEGLAQWMEGDMPVAQKTVLGEAALEGRLLGLGELEGAFRGKREQVDLAYAQSYALVAFLIENGPEGALGAFLKYLEETGDEKLALRRAAGMDLNALQHRWLQTIRTEHAVHALPVSAELVIYSLFGLLFVIAVAVRLRMAREIRERMQAEERFEELMASADFTGRSAPEPDDDPDEEWEYR